MNLEDEQVSDVLLGIQLTGFFAFVGLACYGVGWIKSAQAHVSTNDMAMMTMTQTVQPVPGWVQTGLLVTVAVLVLSAAIDVWLLLEDDDVDVLETLREWGETER